MRRKTNPAAVKGMAGKGTDRLMQEPEARGQRQTVAVVQVRDRLELST